MKRHRSSLWLALAISLVPASLNASECEIELSGAALPWTSIKLRPPASSAPRSLASLDLEYRGALTIKNVWLVSEQGHHTLPDSVRVSESTIVALRPLLARCYREAMIRSRELEPLDCRIEPSEFSRRLPAITEVNSYRLFDRLVKDGSSRHVNLKFDDAIGIEGSKVVPRRARNELALPSSEVSFSPALSELVIQALRPQFTLEEGARARAQLLAVTYFPERDVSPRESSVIGYVVVKLTNGVTLREIAVRRHSLEGIWIEYPIRTRRRERGGEEMKLRFTIKPTLAFRAALEPIVESLYLRSGGASNIGESFKNSPTPLLISDVQYDRGSVSITVDDLFEVSGIRDAKGNPLALPDSHRADGCLYPVIEFSPDALAELQARVESKRP